MVKTLNKLKLDLRQFAKERDWNQFHSPKNLSMALSVEAAEIVEKFQWMTEKQTTHLSEDKLNEVKNEIGDVLIYLVRLADKLGINPVEAAFEKMRTNNKKYPINKSKGKNVKYTEL